MSSIRDENLKSQNDLCEVIKAKNKEIDILRKDLAEIKYSYATRINDLERENKEYSDTLRSTKRLADMQMQENRKLLEKENIRNKEK